MISNLDNQAPMARVVDMPRLFQLRIGDEPVVMLADPLFNRLLGVVANRWTPAVDKVISRAQSGCDLDDSSFRRCEVIEGMLCAGFVYLSFEYSDRLSADARCIMMLRASLAAMLRYPAQTNMVELLEVAANQ